MQNNFLIYEKKIIFILIKNIHLVVNQRIMATMGKSLIKSLIFYKLLFLF